MRPLKQLITIGSIMSSAWLNPVLIQHLYANNTVTISWNQNIEEDLSGYRLYYGITSGQYDFMEETELDTCVTVTNLAKATYYFVVTAYDSAGNESDQSEEISWTSEDPLSITDGGGGSPALPRNFELAQNFPNPFNPSTTINYSIAQEDGSDKVATTIKIYSLRGRAVKTLVDDQKAPGDYLAFWNGESDSGEQLASGTYLYHLQAGTFSSTRKMVLEK